MVIAAEHRARDPKKHRVRDHRHRNKDLERTHATYRKWDLKTSYGMTPEEYEALLMAQNGVCRICGAIPSSERAYGRRLAVDHDHETGRVRGLLCGMCNRAIGLLNDRPEWLRDATHYVEEARYGVYHSI